MTASEKEKRQLEEQVLKLQVEAQDACHALEMALAKNSRLRKKNLTEVTNLQEELRTERNASISLQTMVQEAMGGVEGMAEEMEERISALERENSSLKLDKTQTEVALSNLHEQVSDELFYFMHHLLFSFIS